jgi:hypothetical protein
MCLVRLDTLIYLSSVFTVIYQMTLMFAGFAGWDAPAPNEKGIRLLSLITYLVICRHPNQARSEREATMLQFHIMHKRWKIEGGETNQQVFYVLPMCFVGFLLLVVVRQAFLHILGVFRCCYICCYMLFHGGVCCLVATWSRLAVATKRSVSSARWLSSDR